MCPTKKMGDLIPKGILRKYSIQASVMSKEGKWEGQEVIDNCRHLGTSRGLRCLAC